MNTQCQICGKKNYDGEKFCQHCGAILTQNNWNNQYTNTYQNNYTTPYQQPYKKTNTKIISLIAIIVIAGMLLVALFNPTITNILNPEPEQSTTFSNDEKIEYMGKETDLLGNWETSYYADGMDSLTTESNMQWKIHNNNTIEIKQNSLTSSTPRISFIADKTSKTLTVAAVDNEIKNMYSSWYKYSIDKNKYKITIKPKDNPYSYEILEIQMYYEITDDGDIIFTYNVPEYDDITVTIRLKRNNINATSEKPITIQEDLKWKDIQITGTCDTFSLGTYVKAGDKITNCYGAISIVYIPTSTLLGSFNFYSINISVEPAKPIKKCVAHWGFNEGEGNTVYDQSGNNFDAQNSDCRYVPGVSGYGLEIINTDIARSISRRFDDTISDEFTISCWVKWYGEHPDTYSKSSYIFDARSMTEGFILYIVEDSTIRFQRRIGSERETICSSSNIPTNQWTHIAATFNYNTKTSKIFINGVLDKTENVNLPYYETSISSAIGNNHWAPGDHQWAPLNGVIDELKIYNYELNRYTIKDLYESDKPPAEKDLVGYWNFDETSGNIVYDGTENHNDGAINGQTRTDGYSGNALEFNGISGYVRIPDDDSLNFHDTNQFSISLWIKREGSIMDKSEGIISKGTSAYTKGYTITIGTNNQINFQIQDGTTYYRVLSKTEMDDTDWHHIIAIWDGSTLKLYIDEKLDNSSYIGDIVIADDHKPLEFGNHWGYTDNNHPLHGILDEIKIFNYALSIDELSTLN